MIDFLACCPPHLTLPACAQVSLHVRSYFANQKSLLSCSLLMEKAANGGPSKVRLAAPLSRSPSGGTARVIPQTKRYGDEIVKS